MKIKYVGLKPEETAFSRDTGIVWLQGSSHEVPDGIAKRMLNHPDVFAADDGKAVSKAAVTEPKPDEDETEVAGEAGTTNDGLDAMDKAALHALAKERGVIVHHAAGADKVRQLLRAANSAD